MVVPFGVSPQSRLAKEHPDLLVQDEARQLSAGSSDLYQLCPPMRLPCDTSKPS
jgi:hypothetical protein